MTASDCSTCTMKSSWRRPRTSLSPIPLNFSEVISSVTSTPWTSPFLSVIAIVRLASAPEPALRSPTVDAWAWALP
ncbi:hypothetical protein D3C72_2174140 [compost metagenome]